MREEWRPVVGYEGLYEVSNLGNVKSLERMKWNGKGYQKIPERIMKLRKNNSGYLRVFLCKEGKMKSYLVHQLVATAFLENPMGYTEINHISEDKLDNMAKNLEWVSHKYNCSYGTRNKRVAEKNTNNPKLSKPLIAINKITGLILEFPSIIEAYRQTGIATSNICACCQGKKNSCGGFYWMYANTDDAE